jgi:hypothetical protein
VNEFGQVSDIAAIKRKEAKEPPVVEKLVEDVAIEASGSAKAGTATKRK